MADLKFDFTRLDKPFEADWPVRVSVPKDGGGFGTETFVARLRQVPPEQVDAAIASADFSIYSLPELYFVGLADEDGPRFTPELRRAMVASPWVRKALESAYRDFTGQAASGN